MSTEMPRCSAPCACMNHISSLMESRPPMQIRTGCLPVSNGARTKPGEQRLAVLIGDLQDLTRRLEVLDELPRAFLHVGERFEPARIGIFKPELGVAIVVGRTQPAVHRGAHMALAELLVTAGLVEIRNPLPFPVPALFVAGDHAAGGKETLGDGAAALLRFAKSAAELIAHPRIFRPMVPAVGLIHAVRHVRDLIDQKLFRHNRRNSLRSFCHAHDGSSTAAGRR